jgi:hypothetical protein
MRRCWLLTHAATRAASDVKGECCVLPGAFAVMCGVSASARAVAALTAVSSSATRGLARLAPPCQTLSDVAVVARRTVFDAASQTQAGPVKRRCVVARSCGCCWTFLQFAFAWFCSVASR